MMMMMSDDGDDNDNDDDDDHDVHLSKYCTRCIIVIIIMFRSL